MTAPAFESWRDAARDLAEEITETATAHELSGRKARGRRPPAETRIGRETRMSDIRLIQGASVT
jgi:hypothetical protein